MNPLSRSAVLPAIVLAVLTAVGCDTSPKPGEVPVLFEVEPSRTSIVAGENVTFTATTANTYNRDASIEWTTTGGTMNMIEDDRVARIKFDEEGEYKVSADLLLEGKRVDTEIVKIYVTPVE